MHVVSVMKAMSLFYSPRPIRMIGSAIETRRHTARWLVSGATIVSMSSFLASSSYVACICSVEMLRTEIGGCKLCVRVCHAMCLSILGHSPIPLMFGCV